VSIAVVTAVVVVASVGFTVVAAPRRNRRINLPFPLLPLLLLLGVLIPLLLLLLGVLWAY
jgi:hypothetical protein